MNPSLERLVAVQAKDLALRRLERDLQELPRREEKARARLGEAQRALEAHRERIRQLELSRREGEREADALTTQERKFQSQTPMVKTNEELWALKREIELVQSKRSDLETGILERMEEEEARRRDTAELERAAKAAATAVEEEGRAVAAERARLEEERSALAAQREEMARELAPDMRARYERVRASRGDPAVVALVRNACGGCLTAQPPQRAQEARQGEIVVVCEFCGRLIVGVGT